MHTAQKINTGLFVVTRNSRKMLKLSTREAIVVSQATCRTDLKRNRYMKKVKDPKMVKQGRRNRQRGAELQREVVNCFKASSITAHNRDRGGANHEKGDIEVMGMWLGCKRRTSIPRWLLPEKTEIGVVSRGDRMEAILSLPLKPMVRLISEAAEKGIDVRQIFEGHRLGDGAVVKAKEESG